MRRFIFSLTLFSITFRIVRDVRMVEDRSFEGVQLRQRYIQQSNDKAISIFTDRNFRAELRPLDRGKHFRISSTSRAIKHSSTAQLLLPRTWSERGTANLLEISEVLLVAWDQGPSHRNSIVVRGVLLVFEQRSLYSSLKYVKLSSLGFYVKYYLSIPLA